MSNGSSEMTPLGALVSGVILIGIWLAESSIAYSWIIGLVGAVLAIVGAIALLTGSRIS
jgi:hypothetical protein